MHRVVFTEVARDGVARAGLASTSRGSYETPCYMPVGTRGAVKYLDSSDYADLGASIVLGNTYHLMLRPGAETVAALGGLGAFAAWDGLTLTDSGGYQVFSLEPKVSENGVEFRSVYDGTRIVFDPESAVRTQELLGADIQMVLDVCPPLPSEDSVIRSATERTARWAERARRAHRREDQSLFGIVQGGIDSVMRAESARRTVEIGFDGYGIGGFSVGETREQMLAPLAAALSELPSDQPRYLMGVGDPASMVEAIALGVDQFDCVLQTRLGRHGTALTDAGKVQIKNAAHARSDEPLDAACACGVCRRHSRGYLRHLFQVGEPTGSRLLSLHNLHWTLELMRRSRASIIEGRFEGLRREVLEVWG